ncbi:MAG: OmpA family protein [Deltaproteobacteria bacterium]|nr:OmpA family protein [Deltaproteobacteria bacterium]
MGPMGIKGVKDIMWLPILIPFAYDSDELLPNSKEPLANLGAALKDLVESDRSVAFLIAGFTDPQGKEEYNLVLSEKRAQRAAQYLVEVFHLPADRLRVKGYGEAKPIPVKPDSSEVDYVRSRRVEVRRLKVEELTSYASLKPLQGSPPQEPASLIMDVGIFYEDPESRPQKLQEGAVLRSGDGYRIYFEPHQSCYVYIFQIDSSSKFFPLYPNPNYGTSENFVQARTAYWAPRNKWFELDDTRGKEEIYVVASKECRKDIENLFIRYARSDHPDPEQKEVEELTGVLMGPRKIRGDKNPPVEVVVRTGRVVELTTDQLRQDGVGFAYKVAFHHE